MLPRALVAVVMAAAAAASQAQSVSRAPWVTGELLLKRLEPVSPSAVPWSSSSKMSREELADLHTQTNVEFVQGYIAGLHDATEGKVWCYNVRYQNPKPDTFWDESRWGLHRLTPAQLKGNAADLLAGVWRAKWPCPASADGRQK